MTSLTNYLNIAGLKTRTQRRKAYQNYLKSDHWKALRQAALERDNFQCCACESTDTVQVHHLKYRTPWESGVLEDVETLCRKHHRLEHGYGPTDFEAKATEIKRMVDRCVRPSPGDWKELKALMTDHPKDLEDFAQIIFLYVYYARPTEIYGRVCWWMDKAKSDFWGHRARSVRSKILSH